MPTIEHACTPRESGDRDGTIWDNKLKSFSKNCDVCISVSPG